MIATRTAMYGAVLALLAMLCISVQTAVSPQWAYDGYNYTIRAQVDAGIPFETARAAARDAYAGKPALHAAVARYWIAQPYPQYWKLFATRAVYPWLAGRLWPAFGFRAPFVVSNVAFVLSVVLLYAVVLSFAPPAAAALLTILVASLPEFRLLGRSDLTDMTALAFWLACLLGMIRYVRSGASGWLAFFAVSALLLTFTRPAPYVPLCAGAGVVAAGLWARRIEITKRGAAIAGISFGLCVVLLIVSSRLHAPGTLEVLRGLELQSGTRHMPLDAWYARAVLKTTGEAATWFTMTLVSPLGIIALFLNARRADVALLLGAFASTIPTIVLDPLVSDVPRVMALPMLPVIACGLGIAMRYGFMALRIAPHESDADWAGDRDDRLIAIFRIRRGGRIPRKIRIDEHRQGIAGVDAHVG